MAVLYGLNSMPVCSGGKLPRMHSACIPNGVWLLIKTVYEPSAACRELVHFFLRLCFWKAVLSLDAHGRHVQAGDEVTRLAARLCY